jgi:hypothetical protein
MTQLTGLKCGHCNNDELITHVNYNRGVICCKKCNEGFSDENKKFSRKIKEFVMEGTRIQAVPEHTPAEAIWHRKIFASTQGDNIAYWRSWRIVVCTGVTLKDELGKVSDTDDAKWFIANNPLTNYDTAEDALKHLPCITEEQRTTATTKGILVTPTLVVGRY